MANNPAFTFSNRPSLLIMDDVMENTRDTNNQLQQAAGVDVSPIIPMAVGQQYRRRDGKIVKIIKVIDAEISLFECDRQWCYQCKLVNPETGWQLYSWEENNEDLIELLPIDFQPQQQ